MESEVIKQLISSGFIELMKKVLEDSNCLLDIDISGGANYKEPIYKISIKISRDVEKAKKLKEYNSKESSTATTDETVTFTVTSDSEEKTVSQEKKD